MRLSSKPSPWRCRRCGGSAGAGAPLTRAGYVDMSRLLERLGDVEKFRRRPRPLPIINALALLDF